MSTPHHELVISQPVIGSSNPLENQQDHTADGPKDSDSDTSRAAAERDFRKGINGVNLPSDVETALSTFFQKNVRYMRTMKSEIRVLQEKVAKMEYERTKEIKASDDLMLRQLLNMGFKVIYQGVDAAYLFGNHQTARRILSSCLDSNGEIKPGKFWSAFIFANRAATSGKYENETIFKENLTRLENELFNKKGRLDGIKSQNQSVEQKTCDYFIKRALKLLDSQEFKDLFGIYGNIYRVNGDRAAHPNDRIDETARRAIDSVENPADRASFNLILDTHYESVPENIEPNRITTAPVQLTANEHALYCYTIDSQNRTSSSPSSSPSSSLSHFGIKAFGSLGAKKERSIGLASSPSRGQSYGGSTGSSSHGQGHGSQSGAHTPSGV